jgi:molybdate transport system substrate-binding protein
VAPPKTLAELADPRFRKIAIANPEHAPYGKAAKQALEKAGVWPQIQDRIVLGENIQATMTYAQKGEVDAALVALSLAVAADGGASIPVDQALHDPLDQSLVVCGTGQEAEDAKPFAEFVNSKDGRELMTRYGFLLPDEQLRSKTP